MWVIFPILQPNAVALSTSCGRRIALAVLALVKPEAASLTKVQDSIKQSKTPMPGLCQTFGYKVGKPECLTLSAGSSQDFPLTLNGLWPNQNACGTNYGFCNKKIPPKKSFCKYPPLSLSSEVSDEL